MVHPVNCPSIHFQHEITTKNLENTRNRVLELKQKTLNNVAEAQPFLIITPVGLTLQSKITKILSDQGIVIAKRSVIPNWTSVSTLLYTKTIDDKQLLLALAYEALWQSISLTNEAEKWELAQPEKFSYLVTEKHNLRSNFGKLRFRLILPFAGMLFEQMANLHVFHVPDPESLKEESQILDINLQPQEE